MDVADVKGVNLLSRGPASATPEPAQRLHVADPPARVNAQELPEPPRRAGTRLRVDEASNRIVAQILDEANRVIKQIPPEELLKIAAQFRRFNGLIFDQEA